MCVFYVLSYLTLFNLGYKYTNIIYTRNIHASLYVRVASAITFLMGVICFMHLRFFLSHGQTFVVNRGNLFHSVRWMHY